MILENLNIVNYSSWGYENAHQISIGSVKGFKRYSYLKEYFNKIQDGRPGRHLGF
jgi:hypothetical protein